MIKSLHLRHARQENSLPEQSGRTETNSTQGFALMKIDGGYTQYLHNKARVVNKTEPTSTRMDKDEFSSLFDVHSTYDENIPLLF